MTRGKSPFSLRYNAPAIAEANARRTKASRFVVVKDGVAMGYATDRGAADRLAVATGGVVVQR